MSYKTIAPVFVVAMVGIHVFFLWIVRDHIARADPDFTAYYTAGKILREGKGRELYDPRTQDTVQRRFARDADIRRGPLAYIHPPFEALLFVPLASLPYSSAFATWGLLNLYILFGVFSLMRSFNASLRQDGAVKLVAISLAFFPVFANFHQGQDAILLLLIVALACQSLERGLDLRAGCWLGLGIFKYHLVLPLVLVLIVWRGRRLAFGFLLTASAALMMSLAIVGWHGALQYPQFVWRVVSQPSFGGSPFRQLPSLQGLLGGWNIPGELVWPERVAVLACTAGLLVTLASMRKLAQHKRLFPLCFTCAVLVALLVGYTTSTYDLCLLILPIVLVWDYCAEERAGFSRESISVMLPALPLLISPLWFFLWMRWGRINVMAVFLLWWLFAVRSEVLCAESRREQSRRLALT